MSSNLQINRTLVKNVAYMRTHSSSQDMIQMEWQEIQAAQADPACFRPLYTRYFDPIFRFIYRRTNDEELAGDLCSQVFLKALQHLGKYKPQGVPFSAWLYRIASNEIAQYYRKSKKQRVVSLEEGSVGQMMDELEENQLEVYRPVLLQALEQLKTTDMQLIELRFFEQRPFKEVADIMDISESNAKVRTYRIVQRLKKVMQNML